MRKESQLVYFTLHMSLKKGSDFFKKSCKSLLIFCLVNSGLHTLCFKEYLSTFCHVVLLLLMAHFSFKAAALILIQSRVGSTSALESFHVSLDCVKWRLTLLSNCAHDTEPPTGLNSIHEKVFFFRFACVRCLTDEVFMGSFHDQHKFL